MAEEIKAWTEERTARITHVCRACNGHIVPGMRYTSIALADKVTAGSTKLSHEAEHLDCKRPWYLGREPGVSNTQAIGRLRRKHDSESAAQSLRKTIAFTNEDGDQLLWLTGERLQAALNRTNPTHQARVVGEINQLQALIAAAVAKAIGDKRKAAQLDGIILQLKMVTENN